MKTILHIFVKDVRGLSRNLFALVIAIGLCIIPSLYAWFNIYSNWDPYANTASIKVAVFSEDEGYKQNDENTVNMGNQIVAQLHDNTKIGWLFPETKEDAMEGLYSGEYYATIIVEKDFSYSLYDFLNNGLNHPAITYYENSKKNAVATKITDTGTSTLQQNINTEFIEVVVKTALEHLNTLSADDKDTLDTLIADITGIRTNLDNYNSTIDTFIASNNQLSSSLMKIHDMLPDVKSAISTSVSTAGQMNTTITQTVDSLNEKLEDTLKTMSQVSAQIQSNLEAAASKVKDNAPEAADELKKAATELNALIQQNTDLNEVLEQLKNINGMDSSIIESIQNQLQSVSIITDLAKQMIEQSSDIVKDAPALIEAKYELLKPILDACVEKIDSVNRVYESMISTSVVSLKQAISSSLSNITNSLTDAADGIDGIAQLLVGTTSMITSANQSLTDTKTIIGQLSA